MGSVWSYIVGEEEPEEEVRDEVKEEEVKEEKVKYFTEPPPVFEPDTIETADGKKTFVFNAKKIREDTNRYVEWYLKEEEKRKESYIKKYNVKINK